MRELSESDSSRPCGGSDEAPIEYPAKQSPEEIRRILDQLAHINDKPGTY